MLPPQNYLAWKGEQKPLSINTQYPTMTPRPCNLQRKSSRIPVSLTALHVVAISATVLRIRIRWRGAKLWWDDHLAAGTALVDVIFALTFWLAYGTHAGSIMPLSATRTGWLNLACYFSIYWVSRVSLALSIARVFPPGTVARKTLLAMAAIFASCGIFNCLIAGSLCLWSPSIYPPGTDLFLEEYKNCQPGNLRHKITGGVMAAVDFPSDILGIILPLKFLWRVSLPTNERRLVHGAISASIVTTLSGVVSCVFWFVVTDGGKDVQILMDGVRHQQAVLSVIGCNLLVVVTYWWRKVHRENRPTRRYRHNDPNIPTSKTSSQSPPVTSGSRYHNEGNGTNSSINPGRSFDLESSSQLPNDLTLTPITPLSAESASSSI
ncbi:hypothetical protein BKA70DRAFT_1396146 [Coprinopsis sp. MPI-PUGE-AT-0042]|nr:hypothetical protein BKA70DRAFT_1396146 [Coprinopsis sp. MPI-PUGE-AT-0042]